MAAETTNGKIDDILDGMKKLAMELMLPELLQQLSITIPKRVIEELEPKLTLSQSSATQSCEGPLQIKGKPETNTPTNDTTERHHHQFHKFKEEYS